jgi:GNAT superfamily N-acetyltransferase
MTAPDGLVTIRAAAADDFDAWFELFEAVAAEGKWIGSEAPFDRDSRRQNFEHYLESEDAVTLLAEVDGLLVGDLGAEIRRGVAHIGMLVDERWRGRGVGSRLMESCITWSKGRHAQRRCHRLVQEVWVRTGGTAEPALQTT